MFKTKNIINEKFFADRCSVDLQSGCWNWSGYIQSSGYGQFSCNNKGYLAHRASWEFYNKSLIPFGLYVLHRCDNTRCINPSHLFLGTPLDNVHDCISKGRNKKGFCKGHLHAKKKRIRKLSDEQVREIRATLYNKEPLRVIAARYGVSVPAISIIRRGLRKSLVVE